MTNNEIKTQLVQYLESKLEPEFKYINYMMRIGNASIFNDTELTTNIIKSMYLFNGKTTFNTMNILFSGERNDIISRIRKDSVPNKALLQNENDIDLFIESELKSLFKFENETDQTVWEEAKNVFTAKFEVLEADRIAFEAYVKAEQEEARKAHEERIKQQSPEEMANMKDAQDAEATLVRADITEGEEGYVTNEELGKAMRTLMNISSLGIGMGLPQTGVTAVGGVNPAKMFTIEDNNQ